MTFLLARDSSSPQLALRELCWALLAWGRAEDLKIKYKETLMTGSTALPQSSCHIPRAVVFPPACHHSGKFPFNSPQL